MTPAVPFEGADLVEAVATAEGVGARHGFEVVTSAHALSPRSLDLCFALFYDRNDPDRDGRALRCHDEMVAALVSSGYIPYRLGIQSMEALPEAANDNGLLLKRLKGLLDPNDILAPGRYDFRRDWPLDRT